MRSITSRCSIVATSRIRPPQLFAVDARDPATLPGAVVTVVLAAIVAAYLPARDASRVDPVEVLRAP
jgi:hypothetical protein